MQACLGRGRLEHRLLLSLVVLCHVVPDPLLDRIACAVPCRKAHPHDP